jgi:hypothetical protein
LDEEAVEGPSQGGTIPPMATYVAIAALIALGVLVALWEYLTSLYALMVLAWLVVAAGLMATPLFRRLSSIDGLRLTLLVLGVALAWRYVMLFQDQVLTNDIASFVGRGRTYLNGAVPYTEEFSINKPPAYLYLAAGMGVSVGPSLVATRAVMALVDSLVAVTILWMAEERLSRPHGLMAGLLYALNPLSAAAVGISGHYDPWVVMFALGGVWMLLRRRLLGASFLLGVGFALKLYPAVLLPWVLLAERSWSRRVAMTALFALPMALSWVPVLMENGNALSYYLDYQGGWEPKGGIAGGLAALAGLDPASDAARMVARGVEWAFYGLLAVMFLDWVRRRHRAPDDHLTDWFRVVTVGFMSLYGATIVGGMVEYGVDIGTGTTSSALMVGLGFTILAALALWWTWTRWLPGDLEMGPDDRTIMLAALSVNLLLLSSAQYNPWYLLWLLPLVLLVRSFHIRDAWNGLLLWRPEGAGLSLWPGTELGPR